MRKIISRFVSRLAGALLRCPSLVWPATRRSGAPCTASRQTRPNREIISRTFLSAIALLLTSMATAQQIAPSVGTESPVLHAQGSLQVAFSPWDDIEALVIDVINGAHKQILVQAYLLTSKKIVSTLVAAHRRGVDVRVLLDIEQFSKAGNSAAQEMVAAGIAVWLEMKYQSAHNKIMVIDTGTSAASVVTGSFNFTWTAQHKNAENILIARKNPALAARYAANWERHRQDAISYRK